MMFLIVIGLATKRRSLNRFRRSLSINNRSCCCVIKPQEDQDLFICQLDNSVATVKTGMVFIFELNISLQNPHRRAFFST
jgi:hypothetical protein